MSLTFTFHTPASSLTIGIDAYNALAVDGEDRILVCGSELSTEDRDALTAAFATDGGTVVLSTDAPIAKVRQNVNYVCGKAARKARFAKITANTPEAPIVAYAVRLAPTK